MKSILGRERSSVIERMIDRYDKSREAREGPLFKGYRYLRKSDLQSL